MQHISENNITYLEYQTQVQLLFLEAEPPLLSPRYPHASRHVSPDHMHPGKQNVEIMMWNTVRQGDRQAER